jgi:hypothetical protein
MAHEEISENLSPQEKLFRDYIKRGDDFSRIEVLRYAKYWYKQALSLGFEDHELDEKLENINHRINTELRNIIAIICAAMVLIACYYFFIR